MYFIVTSENTSFSSPRGVRPAGRRRRRRRSSPRTPHGPRAAVTQEDFHNLSVPFSKEKNGEDLRRFTNMEKHTKTLHFFCNLVWKQKKHGRKSPFSVQTKKKVRKVLETTERLKAIFLCWTNRPFFLFSKRTFSISLVVEASFFSNLQTYFFLCISFFRIPSHFSCGGLLDLFLRDSFLVSLSRARQLTTAEPKIPWTVASETTSSLSTNQKVSLKISWKILNISKCSLGNPSIIPLDCRCASFFPKLRFTLLWDNATAARKLGRLRQSGSAGKGTNGNGSEQNEVNEENEVWTKSFECWTWRFAQQERTKLSVRAPIQKIGAQLLSCSAHCPRSLKSLTVTWSQQDHNMTPSLRLVWSSEVRLSKCHLKCS